MSAPQAINVITIDGPAASGKSSVARLVAQRLGWTFVNTGNMYRAVTWSVLQCGINPGDTSAVAAHIRDLALEFPIENGATAISIAGRKLDGELTDATVNSAVSLVARVAEVRQKLVAAQRSLTSIGPLVMEGRDIGSVVFPDAAFKFYIDASEAVRQSRRAAQGSTDVISARDHIDSTRKTSPLIAARGSVIIDSSHLALEQVVERILSSVRAP